MINYGLILDIMSHIFKTKFLSLFILVILFFSLNNATAYTEFGGNYNYSQYTSGGQTVIQNFDKNEEVLFIVDFSGSMNTKMGYSPRAYLAVDAITSILRETQGSTKVGLRIFGVTNKPMVSQSSMGITFNKENVCTASDLVVPISSYNLDRIEERLSRISPKGGTPIGYSLRQAVQNDFSYGPQLKHIILITDGGENCGDNPCAFIRQLLSMRNDFRIDVVGIAVDNNAYSQLSCIASAGGGQYYSVNTPEDFKIKFKQAFNNVSHTSQLSSTYSTPSNNAVPNIPREVERILPYNIMNSPAIKYKSYGLQFEY